jgi:Tol biopolymer transport system component
MVRCYTSGRAGWIAWLPRCALLASVAEAQGFNVVIKEGSEAAVPIAVVPFGWQGSGPPAFDVAGVVSADLASTGRFEPVPTRDMVSRPTQAQQVNFQDWRLLQARYLVIGTLAEASADNFAATFQLFDVVQGQSLTAFRLDAARADLRRASHHRRWSSRSSRFRRLQHADCVRQRGWRQTARGSSRSSRTLTAKRPTYR